MPKIPTYTASLDYKPPRGDLDTAAQPGQMLAKFGQAVGTFGEAIIENQRTQEKAARDRLAKQAALDNALKSARDEIERANGTAQWLDELHKTVESFRADTEPQTMMERFNLSIGNLRQDVAAGIGDAKVRVQVEQDMSRSIGVQSALMQGDSLRSASARGRQELNDHLALYRDIAVDARHPLEFDEAIDLAVGEIRRKAKAGFLSAEDVEQVERTFYADVSEHQVRRAIAADPQSALASLKGGEDFAMLPTDRRTRLIDEADRAVQAQSVARTTAAAAERRDIEIRLPGFIDALRDDAIPDDDRFSQDSLTTAFGDEDGASYWAKIEDARAFGKATARVKWAAPDEITRMLDADSDPAASDEDTPHRALLAQAVDRRNEQLWSKPADYALANPRIAELHDALRRTAAQPKLPAALSDDERHAATAAYANATLAEQERLGLPGDRRQVLPAAQAQDLVARILDGDTKAAADSLSDLIATWGDAAPTALTDLSRHGLPGEYRLLASFTDPAARQTFAKVLTAQATDPGALRGKAGDEAEGVDGKVSDALAPLMGSSGGNSIVLAQGAGGASPTQNPPLQSPGLPKKAVGPHESNNARFLQAWEELFGANANPNASPPSRGRVKGATERLEGMHLQKTPQANVAGVLKPPQAITSASGEKYWPARAVALHDVDGRPVMRMDEKGNPQQVLIPEGTDLRVFAAWGLADRPDIRAAFAAGLSELSIKSIIGKLQQETGLGLFPRGGTWDLQRPGLVKDSSGQYINFSQFVDVATVAIGIYCSAAGLPFEAAALGMEKYAKDEKSQFGTHANMHWLLKYIPERNINNLRLGYYLEERKLIPGPAE